MFAMGGGEAPTREEREAALRETIARLSEDADEPRMVAAALVAIRKHLRGSPDGPTAVVRVRRNADFLLRRTAATAETMAPSLGRPGSAISRQYRPRIGLYPREHDTTRPFR